MIVWTEQGGPSVTAPAGPGGFRNKFILRSLAQISKSFERSWQPVGVVVTTRIRKTSLST